MSEQILTRDQEIQQIHVEYSNFYRLLGGGALVTMGIAIGAVMFSGATPLLSDISGYFTNLYTEAVSVVLTIFVLNYLQERREAQRRIKDLQEELIRQAGSPIHSTAISAIDTMRKRGWLFGKNIEGHSDAILRHADLSNADLHDANLSGVDMSGVNLRNANLVNADMRFTNLRYANLRKANLVDVDFEFAMLEGADLRMTTLNNTNLRKANLRATNLAFSTISNSNLSNTNLSNSNLREVNFANVNLQNANLFDAIIQSSTHFDEDTILPDGSKWTTENDLSKFAMEARDVKSHRGGYDEAGNQYLSIDFTFADGTQRRWKFGEGWLDDRNGNPLT